MPIVDDTIDMNKYDQIYPAASRTQTDSSKQTPNPNYQMDPFLLLCQQADYHQDKFKTFPHVNSPAWLIREIATRHVPAQEEEGLGGFGTPV